MADGRPISLKKVISFNGYVSYWERTGKRWQRVPEFTALEGLESGYYRRVYIKKKRRGRCNRCEGPPTQRDIETNEGKLSKWFGERLCSQCILQEKSDEDWLKYDRAIMEMTCDMQCPLAEVQGVNFDLPRFTRAEKARIDQFMHENGITMSMDQQKSFLFSGKK
jgi:hypothetical protein